MPFDNTTMRRPTVTVLPPTPPERGGGPQRIHVEIEIVERRTRPPRRSSALWWLLLFLVLALAAHAQPMHSYTLSAIVRDASGKPSVLAFGYGADRQGCLTALDALRKMQPDAVITQACIDMLAVPRDRQ